MTSQASTLDELAQRAQAGDRLALERLVGALEAPLYRLAARMLGDREQARDATQEVLILVITQLSTFRGESSVKTWCYRVAMRHVLRQRRRGRRFSFEALAEEDLGQPPNAIEPETLRDAEQALLEEEIFLGCTQAMLLCLEPVQRAVFVLGAICDLEARESAAILGTSEVAFRKRLSRARETLDGFVAKHCGVADPHNRCHCRYQVNHNVALGRVNPKRLRLARPGQPSAHEAMAALGEIKRVRRSLELYRAQPEIVTPEGLAERIRAVIRSAGSLSIS